MSQVMIVVEFETKPEHRSQFIDLMRGRAERSRRDDGCLQFDLMLPKDDDERVFWSRSGAYGRRSMPTRRGRCRVTPKRLDRRPQSRARRAGQLAVKGHGKAGEPGLWQVTAARLKAHETNILVEIRQKQVQHYRDRRSGRGYAGVPNVSRERGAVLPLRG